MPSTPSRRNCSDLTPPAWQNSRGRRCERRSSTTPARRVCWPRSTTTWPGGCRTEPAPAARSTSVELDLRDRDVLGMRGRVEVVEAELHFVDPVRVALAHVQLVRLTRGVPERDRAADDGRVVREG